MASPRKLTMPVFGFTAVKGGGGLEAEACTDKAESDGAASKRRSGGHGKREAAARPNVDEGEPKDFA